MIDEVNLDEKFFELGEFMSTMFKPVKYESFETEETPIPEYLFMGISRRKNTEGRPQLIEINFWEDMLIPKIHLICEQATKGEIWGLITSLFVEGQGVIESIEVSQRNRKEKLYIPEKSNWNH